MFNKADFSPEDSMYQHIDSINKSIATMRSLVKDEVVHKTESDFDLLRGQVDLFLQAQLRRALMFLDGGKHALDAGYGLITLVCVRCIFESAACIHDFFNQIIKHMESGEVMEAVRIAHQRSYAQKFEVKERNNEHLDYTAVQILKQVDAMGKIVPGARRTYDQLSEVVHPNAFGSLLYFMQDERDGAFVFGKGHDHRELNGIFLEGARLFSLINDDILRFYGAIAKYWADTLQTRIDEYDARKRATQESST
jgi:hypothetical protein